MSQSQPHRPVCDPCYSLKDQNLDIMHDENGRLIVCDRKQPCNNCKNFMANGIKNNDNSTLRCTYPGNAAKTHNDHFEDHQKWIQETQKTNQRRGAQQSLARARIQSIRLFARTAARQLGIDIAP